MADDWPGIESGGAPGTHKKTDFRWVFFLFHDVYTFIGVFSYSVKQYPNTIMIMDCYTTTASSLSTNASYFDFPPDR